MLGGPRIECPRCGQDNSIHIDEHNVFHYGERPPEVLGSTIHVYKCQCGCAFTETVRNHDLPKSDWPLLQDRASGTAANHVSSGGLLNAPANAAPPGMGAD